MAWYLSLTLFALCLYQDVRHRGIHWLVFPLLFLSALWLSGTPDWKVMAVNAGIFCGMLVLLSIYLSLKEGRLVQLTKGYFGWGDILFLLAVTPLFDTLEYLMFFTIGTLLSLIIHGVSSLIVRQANVPYAGYMALMGMVTLLFPEVFISLLSLA